MTARRVTVAACLAIVLPLGWTGVAGASGYFCQAWRIASDDLRRIEMLKLIAQVNEPEYVNACGKENLDHFLRWTTETCGPAGSSGVGDTGFAFLFRSELVQLCRSE